MYEKIKKIIFSMLTAYGLSIVNAGMDNPTDTRNAAIRIVLILNDNLDFPIKSDHLRLIDLLKQYQEIDGRGKQCREINESVKLVKELGQSCKEFSKSNKYSSSK